MAQRKLNAKDMIAEFCGSEARTNNISRGAKRFLKDHRPSDAYLFCAAVIIHDLFDPEAPDEVNRQRVCTGLELASEDLRGLENRISCEPALY